MKTTLRTIFLCSFAICAPLLSAQDFDFKTLDKLATTAKSSTRMISRSPAARSVPRLSIWHEYDAELAVARERVLALRQAEEVPTDQDRVI